MLDRKYVQSTEFKDFNESLNPDFPLETTTMYVNQSNIPKEELDYFYVRLNKNKTQINVFLCFKMSVSSAALNFEKKYKETNFTRSLGWGVTTQFSFVVRINDSAEWKKFIPIMKEIFQLDPQTESELLAIRLLKSVELSQITALLPNQFAEALELAQSAIDKSLVFKLGLHCKALFLSDLLPDDPLQAVFDGRYLQMTLDAFQAIPATDQDYAKVSKEIYQLLSIGHVQVALKNTVKSAVNYQELLFEHAVDSDLDQTTIDNLFKQLAGSKEQSFIGSVRVNCQTLLKTAEKLREINAENLKLKEEIALLRQKLPEVTSEQKIVMKFF